jgi:hypothetical protein
VSVLGVRYNFGTTEGEKEWVAGSKATPNEALGFFDFVVGEKRLGPTTLGLKPTTLEARPSIASTILAECDC